MWFPWRQHYVTRKGMYVTFNVDVLVNSLPVWLIFTCKVAHQKSSIFVHICISYCKKKEWHFFIWTRCKIQPKHVSSSVSQQCKHAVTSVEFSNFMIFCCSTCLYQTHVHLAVAALDNLIHLFNLSPSTSSPWMLLQRQIYGSLSGSIGTMSRVS